MRSPAAPTLRSIRRLNRRVHDPIADWLGAMFASLARHARPQATEAPCLPERQDLYGFTEGHATEPAKQ